MMGEWMLLPRCSFDYSREQGKGSNEFGGAKLTRLIAEGINAVHRECP